MITTFLCQVSTLNRAMWAKASTCSAVSWKPHQAVDRRRQLRFARALIGPKRQCRNQRLRSNLRRDPFEPVDFHLIGRSITSPSFYLVQATVAAQIENFTKFPPRRKPTLFNRTRC